MANIVELGMLGAGVIAIALFAQAVYLRRVRITT